MNVWLKRLCLTGLLLASLGHAVAAEPPVTLVPPPKQVEFGEGAIRFQVDEAAIVVGDRATDPEKYAAELLQKNVAKRFGVKWPIVAESKDRPAHPVEILLGQPSTSSRVDQLCRDNGIELSPESPGFDGYVIEMVQRDGRHVVMVGGSNPRGVIYGQDTLFQLMGRDGGGLSIARAKVRDWPSIPWRGRPRTNYKQYLRPGELDCYMTSRVNWIDLRTGTYAFGVGEKLDKEGLSEVIAEAHRCGLIVYSAVNCGVSRNAYDGVLKMFQDMIELGADGVFLSFDDKGPGDAPEELVTKMVTYARSKGITDHLIGICPPKSSYQEIDTEFNRKIMAIPGMERAMWVWTLLPIESTLKASRGIGLKAKYMWWHNWPRPQNGLTHIDHRTLHKGEKWSYLELPSLKCGWHGPDYDMLADGEKYCDSVMPWGGMEHAQYYHIPVLNWWAWDPGKHDFDELRKRIYRIVYGAGQVEAMVRFDEAFVALKRLFACPDHSSEWFPACPARLKDQGDRERALKLVEKLAGLCDEVEKNAPGESMLPVDELKHDFLDAMRDELIVARAAATLPYPEYWWDAHFRKLLTAVYDNDLARADALATEVRDRVMGEVGQVKAALGDLKIVDEYVRWWTQHAALDGRGWQQVVADRRAELPERVWDYGYYVVLVSKLLQGLNDPPLDWGTGRWEHTNRVLATVLPTDREVYWGDWIAGLYREKGGEPTAAVFAAKQRDLTTPGTYAELEVNVPISGDRDRLAMLLYLANVNSDVIGLHHVADRWVGHRAIRLLWGEKVLWEADLGWTRETGEWLVVKLPTIPEGVAELPLRLRVEELRRVSGSGLVFFGPIRLIQLPE